VETDVIWISCFSSNITISNPCFFLPPPAALEFKMPGGNYIATPETAADHPSYLSTGLNGLDDLSPEKSFASPSKGRDLIQSLRRGRSGGVALSLKTPRAGGSGATRDPLHLLPNGRNAAAAGGGGQKGEFTPLMMSVTKKNHLQRTARGKRKSGIQSSPPSFMQENSILNGGTMPLPRLKEDSQMVYDERTSSSTGDAANETPMPQAVSSSAQSTPLAQLPGRDGRFGVVGDGNMMTLREQENVRRPACAPFFLS
jgi:hypothetical protein